MNLDVNCDSYWFVTRKDELPRIACKKRRETIALLLLLVMGGLALAGPSGVLSWNENLSILEQRKTEIARLQAERDELRNRVALLDPKAADPDLVGELLRRNLNVVHPDEVVMTIK